MIKKASIAECRELAQLAVKMWKSHTIEELTKEFEEIVNSKEAACFITYDNDIPIAFAQCGLRHDYVEGTESSPVGYLEGIYVDDSYRKQGNAKALLQECESWARNMNCVEFASDCELQNEDSLKFHISMGFEEANRIICFTKKLQ